MKIIYGTAHTPDEELFRSAFWIASAIARKSDSSSLGGANERFKLQSDMIVHLKLLLQDIIFILTWHRRRACETRNVGEIDVLISYSCRSLRARRFRPSLTSFVHFEINLWKVRSISKNQVSNQVSKNILQIRFAEKQN